MIRMSNLLLALNALLWPGLACAQTQLKISPQLSSPATTAPAGQSDRKDLVRDIAQAKSEKRNPRGIVRAAGEATLASRIAGQVLQTPFREGESFRRGEVL